MIAYFDTSAVIPLIVEEPGSAASGVAWDAAHRVVSVRLVEVEARAVLAQAVRADRVTTAQWRALKRELDDLLAQMDLVGVDDEVVRNASDLAEHHALRADDALHLSAALTIVADDLVVVAGDRALLSAATAVGLPVVSTS